MTLYLDPAPLLNAAGDRTTNTTAHLLGVTRETIERWRSGRRRICHTDADRYAVALGFVSYELWPELLETAIAEVERPCARCERPFIPTRSFQKYCRAACRVASQIEARPQVEPVERSCDWCGSTFMSIRASHIRCSQACNRAARYATHGDEERAYQREYNAQYRARGRTQSAA